MWSTGPWRETDEYKEAHARDLHGTGGRLDPICLSHTHDPDYAEYRAYPKGKGPKRGARGRVERPRAVVAGVGAIIVVRLAARGAGSARR